MIDELLLLMHFIYELSKLEFCTKKENLEISSMTFFTFMNVTIEEIMQI